MNGTKEKIFFAISWMTIVAALGLICLVFYWLIFPYKTVVFGDVKFPIAEKTVKAGQMVYYTSNYCKYMDVTAIVTRTFIDEIMYVTPSTISNRPLGCHSIVIGVQVPDNLPLGTYRMQQVYEIQVNPIRTITIQEDTVDFQVIANTP